MLKISKLLIFLLIFAGLMTPFAVLAQMEGLHGDVTEMRNGVHAGNQFRTTIYNDGRFGAKQRPPDFAGEWPINSGHLYMIDGNVFVGSEVIDANGELRHIVSTVHGGGGVGSWSSGDTGPNGEPWTFLPLRGFANPDTNKIAMSKWPWSWPDFWPDKFDDAVDPGWPGAWNGYFGKNIFNADEESFFVADDYEFREFEFYPDSTDPTRKGLGMRMWVRGFQWSNALVEDAMFALFDLENIGTFEHDKMVFAYKFGNNMGDTETGYDSNDDMGAFEIERDVAYLYDYDDIGYGGWTPVGYFGGVFLESPGNPYDGLDNDGDAGMGPGPVIDEAFFAPKILNTGDPIVLIDYKTFERTVTTMGTDTVIIPYQDLVFKFWPGKRLEEKPNNLVDDNLNGIIDENNGSVIGEPPNQVQFYLFLGQKYIDYFTGEGADNLLLDEKRDDLIDNDGDWSVVNDDVGLDGVPNTGDIGEGDGVPTSGAGTEFPGEPHIDKTDIDESDMLGLTSFTLYVWEDIPHYEDEIVWQNIVPGYFDDLLENTNVELLYGSGYFPSKPGQIERFSMGILCGISLDDFLRNTEWVSRAYNENYNFSKAPAIPTVQAVPGDGEVTLTWDDLAEYSFDPISGYDFEGYRIYRSTDPGWNDMTPISDGYGSVTFRKPLAQFDLDNDYAGFAPVDIKGVKFYLGDNTGLVHSFTDSTVRNGLKYYYAVTSYDRGDPLGIPPTECSRFVSISTSGEVDKGANVALVRPEAPAAGYHGPRFENMTLLEGSGASGTIGYEIISQSLVKDKHTYQIVFQDTLVENADRALMPVTKNFSLVDVTRPGYPDTLINKSTDLSPDARQPVTDGFRLKLYNIPEVRVNRDSSFWSRDSIYDFLFEPFRYSRTTGIANAADYLIEFGEVGIDTSTKMDISIARRMPAIPVNFRITNLTTQQPIDFGFREQDALPGKEGKLSAFSQYNRTDQVVFLEKNDQDSVVVTWAFEFDPATDDTTHHNPEAGDSLVIRTLRPFLSNDVYQFTTIGEGINKKAVAAELDRIKVVPNPYVVANSFEPVNPYANGRGPRELHFTRLPEKCTVKIFNVRGQLVRELEHNSRSVADGTLIWDMQTKDQLDIAYGVYIYHVDAGELGSKIGKFAVIK